MMPMWLLSTYSELKNWQSGIGTLVGFLALSRGATINFRLNRKRDLAIRVEEANSVAAALYGEILLLRREVAQVARHLTALEKRYGTCASPGEKYPVDAHWIEAHSISEPFLYRALAPKIGLLEADLVIALAEFHKNVQEVRTALHLLDRKPDRGYNYSPLIVLEPARDAVLNVLPAMERIRERISLEKPPDIVDLGDTEMHIEFERSQFDGT